MALPAARRVGVWCDNLGVRRRNRLRRREAARLLPPARPRAVARKLEAARAYAARGRQDVRAGEDALYTTARTLLERAERNDPTRDAWEGELERRTGGGKATRAGPRFTLGPSLGRRGKGK